MTNYVMPIVVMLFSLIIGGLAILFIFTYIRSHRLRLRYMMNDRKYVEDYWVMEHSDNKTGDIYWKSVWFQKQIKTEKPPDHIIDIGKKGKFYAELYVYSKGSDGTLEGVWINDDTEITDKNLVLQEDNKKIVDTFKPFSTTQRAFATRQFKKAEDRRNSKWDVQKIANFAFMGLFLITIIAVAIFLPDILDKQREIEGIRLQQEQKQLDITNKQLAIVQAMGVKIENWDVVVSQTVKQKSNSVITTNNEVQPQE